MNMYCVIKLCLLLSFRTVLLEPAVCNEILKPDVTCCGICIMPLVKFEALRANLVIREVTPRANKPRVRFSLSSRNPGAETHVE